MNYAKAREEDLEPIYQLVQQSIRTVYPQYYPQAIVDFFSNLHTQDNIWSDLRRGHIRGLYLKGRLIATGTLKENHILRVFVLPEFQDQGYGSLLMRYLEEEIALEHNLALLEASLCASCFYEKQGYKTISHTKLCLDSNACLVYENMEKSLNKDIQAICYEGKFFGGVFSPLEIEIDEETLFSYHQNGNTLWAEYGGGEVKKGHIIGNVEENGELSFYYNHINQKNEMKIGKCHSVPRILENGKIELFSQWQWLNGDRSKGIAIIREK